MYVDAAATVTDDVNKAIKTVAAETGSAYVDLRAAFKGPDYSYDETHYLASDGDHPTPPDTSRSPWRSSTWYRPSCTFHRPDQREAPPTQSRTSSASAHGWGRTVVNSVVAAVNDTRTMSVPRRAISHLINLPSHGPDCAG
jgi:hypothetical protein